MNRFMNPAEGLVLVAAVMLAVVVFVKGRYGTLSTGAGVLLLALALLAALASLLHMEARALTP